MNDPALSQSPKPVARRQLPWWILSLCIVAYLVTVLGYAVLLPKFFSSAPSNAGEFGDMFGAFNAVFTGLAFGGVIYTVWLQTRQVEMQAEELRLQRVELEQTRYELARSATAQERSEKAFTAQLQAAAIAARLSAVSQLIGYEIAHIESQHANLIPGSSPTVIASVYLDTWIARFEQHHPPESAGPEVKCFISNMKRYRDLKADLESLYELSKKLVS